MRKLKTVGKASGAIVALLVVAAPALAADSLSDSIEQFLDSTQTKIEETKLWKFSIKPSLRESVIWTDNVFLNDAGETDLRLLRVTDSASGTTITNRDQLNAIERRLPDFAGASTQGRQSDFIFQSELGTDLVLPVSDAYFKQFRQNQLTLLGVTVRNQEYLDQHELDNTSVFLHTDLFGMVSDLLNQEWGNGFWVRAKDDYSYLRDPLDTEIRLLGQSRILPVKTFDDFGRIENVGCLEAGYNGGQMDAKVGYENYHLWLRDDALAQAEHSRQDFYAEVGTQIPGWEQWRAFVRYDYAQYRFADAPIRDARGNVVDRQQVLNDADVNKGSLGVETNTGKMTVRVESGYESWRPIHDGLSGDTGQFAGVVSHVRVAYKPFEDDRNTTFQFDYQQSLDYSAISNFNDTDAATLSVIHEVIPKRLQADVSVSFSTTNPSDGPYRKLLETGFGLTYHMYKQLDLTFRYAFRHQTAHHEILTDSDFQRGTNLYSYEVRSDSAFFQNILELGFLLHF